MGNLENKRKAKEITKKAWRKPEIKEEQSLLETKSGSELGNDGGGQYTGGAAPIS